MPLIEVCCVQAQLQCFLITADAVAQHHDLGGGRLRHEIAPLLPANQPAEGRSGRQRGKSVSCPTNPRAVLSAYILVHPNLTGAGAEVRRVALASAWAASRAEVAGAGRPLNPRPHRSQ